MQPPDQPAPGEPNPNQIPPTTPPIPPSPPSVPPVDPIAPSPPAGIPPIPPQVPPGAPPPPPPPDVPLTPPGGAPPPGPGGPPPPPSDIPGGAKETTPKFNFGFLPTPPFTPEPSKDDKMWAMITHIGGALGGLTAYLGVPGGNILIPLIVWLIKRDNSRFLDDQGKEVLNFQILLLLVTIACIITCVGMVLIIPIGIAALVLGIVGGVKANEGATYRYPVNWRLIK